MLAYILSLLFFINFTYLVYMLREQFERKRNVEADKCLAEANGTFSSEQKAAYERSMYSCNKLIHDLKLDTCAFFFGGAMCLLAGLYS